MEVQVKIIESYDINTFEKKINSFLSTKSAISVSDIDYATYIDEDGFVNYIAYIRFLENKDKE